jgi:hypothetical protein
LAVVQSALGLQHARPCSWSRGIAGDEPWFIAPPVQGWILVSGSGLPDPDDDVDVCYRFLTRLSRLAGPVQYFSANRVLNHHAWAWLRNGRVLRAYAWAGSTLWQQGAMTSAETELNMKCLDYADPAEAAPPGSEPAAANTMKVPLLAARWSFDPARIDERFLLARPGIAGESRPRR